MQFEVQMIKKLDHPNVVKFKRCFEDERNVYIVMELCRLGVIL